MGSVMSNSILDSLKEAASALRSGGSNGSKVKIGPKEIKRTRKVLEMTQEQFADKVGVSVQTVRSWEQGINKPGPFSAVILGALISETRRAELVG